MEAKKMETKKIESKVKETLTVIKASKMPQNLAEIAIQTTIDGLNTCKDLHQAADYVKEKFERDAFVDEETGDRISTKGVWHCVIGRKFGSFVTFAEGNFIHFYHGQMCILIWKSS
mmetsp:Transcript_31339/g.55081  ORF Transcript_31339/g.55081 Transcript_31339/m.55081 type:complete len:116 (-) Transcript_31339:242-589(-)